MHHVLAAIREQDDIEGIRSLVIEAGRHFGTTCSSYHLTPRFEPQNSSHIRLCSEGFPKDWVGLYHDPGFRALDPIPDHVLAAGIPLTWSQAISEIRALPHAPEGAERFFAAMEEHGLHHGIGIPLYGSNCRDAYASFGFDDPIDLHSGKVEHLVTMMNAAHRRVVRLLDACEKRDVRLSEREQEVLERIAEGCSNNEIAAGLGISPETVGTYVKRLFDKLDTRDRIGATVKGLKLGLIYA